MFSDISQFGFRDQHQELVWELGGVGVGDREGERKGKLGRSQQVSGKLDSGKKMSDEDNWIETGLSREVKSLKDMWDTKD